MTLSHQGSQYLGLLKADEMISPRRFEDGNTLVACSARLGAYFHSLSVKRTVFLSYDNRDAGKVIKDVDRSLTLPFNDRLHLSDAGPVVPGDTEKRATQFDFARCGGLHHWHVQYAIFADVAPAGEGNGHQVTGEPVLQWL